MPTAPNPRSRSAPDLRTVYLSPSDPLFFGVVGEIASALRERSCVPILGAGISRLPPSCMPLGGCLERELRGVLWESAAEFERRSPLPESVRSSARCIIEKARLERMLDALQRTHGPGAIYEFLSVLRGAEWNRNHAAIAALSIGGFLPRCVTLNFDMLIEHAVVARAGAAETVCPLRDFAGFTVPSGRQPCLRIIKPHGSWAPDYYLPSRFDLLAPTLADVGNHPDPRTRACLAGVLGEGRCALVAGYSDNDWDVFPILRSRQPALSHVHWVEFLDPTGVGQRALPTTDRFKRVREWLSTCGQAATLMLGDPSVLLEHVCAAVGVKQDRDVGGPNHVKLPRTDQFLSDGAARLATLVSLALLLQDRGQYHDELVGWLLTRTQLRESPRMSAIVHRTAAHSCHTRRDLPAALRHMDRCLFLMRRGSGLDREGLADGLVWAGYEHLCMTKRPSVEWLLLFPPVWHWHRGLRVMGRGLIRARTLSTRELRKLSSKVVYYRGDLLHSWAALMFLIGGRLPRSVGRYLCRRASTWYARASAIDFDTMNWEYYWLRKLEARLLGGAGIDDAESALARIGEIKQTYEMLQNQPQIGNTLAYEALIVGSTASGRARADELLTQAEGKWSADDGFAPSGLMRIILFRRVLGLKGPRATLRDLRSLYTTIKSRGPRHGTEHA